ncbi:MULTISPECIES: GNAT family N-acetyltransferase [Mesorhizobium]|uniref:GNAT family N-acetyltransferase n=1 Tax=Mesorhizobium denitrificans TaxID=2294114 RepID=A0A371XJL0_9HYPH|nr:MULTISPECIES: GNAT family N-acetyltransferase [Mesorhizobium]RFC69427.1 GNAT family N-acetyltransferase [Mesorhizobium denitrificans]
MTANCFVRPAAPADRDAFLSMWSNFVALAPDEPGNPDIGELNWNRIMDTGCGLRCLIACASDTTPAGFTLYLAFPFTWSRGDACYLQDIYVDASYRGKGIAQAMLTELKSIGESAGWYKIFWMTQPDNHAAQRLYEKVAQRMDYLRYDLVVGPP